jgi:hypothetical protein
LVLDVLLTLGLLWSTASQLRPDGAAVGPGEVCLAVWAFVMFFREVSRLGPPLTRPLATLVFFWLVFTVAQCVGTMVGFATGDRHDSGLFAHDVAAYLLMALVSCLSVVEPGARSRMHRVSWLLATLGAAWLALQVAFGWGWVDLGDFDTWEWDRFRGLSDNANQLALFCAVVGLLSLHLAATARRFREKVVALACMIIAIIVGRLTMSDAFLLVLLAAGPIFGSLTLWRCLMLQDRQTTLRSAFARILVLSLPLTAACVISLGASVSNFEELVMGMTKGGGDRDTEETTRLRIEIWDAAINRGAGAGMLGLGPGPHLEIPSAIVAGRRESTNDPKHVEHPEYGLVPNFEAHNTFLDLFVQGGLIAVLSFGGLVTTALIATHRSKFDALTTLLLGLAIFSIFHLIVRHPTVWFALSVCLLAAADPRGPATSRVAS